MDNFTYCTPTRYIFGKDTETQAGKMTAEMGCKNILLVYGHGSVVRSGLLDRVKKSLDDANITYTELSGIDPNPTDDRVYEGIEIVRQKNIDGFLAVGGGSVIDTAKAIALGVPYNGDFWDFYSGKANANTATALPVGVVLTIPAAGSEGSGNSVITRKDGLHKISLRTDFTLRPKFAILNPELTFTLPQSQTVAGIADMMAHIMERYFTPTPDVEVTDRISEGILKAIIEEAPKVVT
ncbi:MAG: iron-containing alcohol dehydrogenase, partial [Muribaculaceae bacterium]|nr:iron-containing alcohol dehydrogenase [Muribaculaceae bacterium]